MENLNLTISKKLTELRKKNKLTQLEVAEKLNYSDKAVSKWEQGESLPGIEVLCKLSELYGVSLDYLVGKENGKPQRILKAISQMQQKSITLLSILAVWLVATFIYVFIRIFSGFFLWIIFCWAIPASFIVSIIFSVVWHKRKLLFTLISLLIWSLLLCFCIQFVNYNIWDILGIGIILQIATLISKKIVK